jgi:hypothetical protein
LKHQRCEIGVVERFPFDHRVAAGRRQSFT